jgi:YD repeat-containing protein
MLILLIVLNLQNPANAQKKAASEERTLKTLKTKVCDYYYVSDSGGINDSTGFYLSEAKWFNNGKIIKQCQLTNEEPIKDIPNTSTKEKQKESVFISSNKKMLYDTTIYKYNSKHQVVEVYEYVNDLNKFKTITTYNLKGDTLTQKTFNNDQLGYTYQFNYDSIGRFTTKIMHRKNDRSKCLRKFKYDNESKKILCVTYIDPPMASDSSVYSYSGEKKIITTYFFDPKYRNISEWPGTKKWPFKKCEFLNNDSLIYSCSYDWFKNKYASMEYYLSDSSFITRDRNTLNRIHCYGELHSAGTKLVNYIFRSYNTFGLIINNAELSDADTIRIEKWEYDTLDRIKIYKEYEKNTLSKRLEYYYDASGNIREKRLYNKDEQLIRKEVIYYEYSK